MPASYVWAILTLLLTADNDGNGTAGSAGDNTTEPATADGERGVAADRRVPRLADLPQGEPADFWREYFKTHEPAPGSVQARVRELNEAGRHDHVVALIESALINGQSQPWMYEILALSMTAVGRPQAEVERVVLSLADFGQASYDSICQSARYLLSFDRDEASLQMLEQAARMNPERPEAFLLAIPAVERSRSVPDAMWALPGALEQLWGEDSDRTRRRVVSLGRRMAAEQDRAGRREEAAKLRKAVETAAAADLEVRLQWDGAADLDLLVTDPSGETCSFAEPETTGGGRLLKDGFGPLDPSEHYVCPRGFPGDYLIEIVTADGEPVGGRATLTISKRTDTGVETRRISVAIGDTAASHRVELEAGRREKPRVLTSATDRQAGRPRVRTARGGAIARPGAVSGAVGSVVQTVSEGTALSATATVSPDRRHVRLGLSPWFSSLVDVETFSYIGGQ